MHRANGCILPAPHFYLELQTGVVEVPVTATALLALQGLRLMAQPFFLGVECGCGLSAPLLPSGSMGISSYFPPPPEVYVQGAFCYYVYST